VDELADRRKKMLLGVLKEEFLDDLKKVRVMDLASTLYGVSLSGDCGWDFHYVVDVLRNGVCACRNDEECLERAISLAKKLKNAGLGDFYVKRHTELSPIDPQLKRLSINELEELIEGEEE
jgi:hypothetical protein